MMDWCGLNQFDSAAIRLVLGIAFCWRVYDAFFQPHKVRHGMPEDVGIEMNEGWADICKKSVQS